MTEYTAKIPTESIITRTIVEQDTLRDQFAMAALTGMLSNPNCNWTWEGIAQRAYIAADAILAAREQKK